MKKALSIFILGCFIGNSVLAMDKAKFHTISFEPEHATGYYPLAMPVIQISKTDYQLEVGGKWQITTNHPFTFAIKKTDNPSHDPELCLLVTMNNVTYAMPVSFVNEAPNNNLIKAISEAQIVTIAKPIKMDVATSTEQPITVEIATSTDNSIIVDQPTESMPCQPKILSYVLGLPIVGLALFGGYEAIQKAKTYYEKNPNFFKEQLQKIKQLCHIKTAA